MRFDAGFAEGPLLDFLTDEKIPFLARLRANARLQDLAAPYLRRPAGRPPKGGREVLVELGTYQAESWRHPQRVILVIVDYPDPKTGQLFLEPEHFFLVTSYSEQQRSAEERLEHYRRRGTFEDRLGEFRQWIGPKLSSQEFASNEATLLLSLSGVQPGEHAAVRVGRRGRGLLGLGSISEVGAQGGRADRQEGCAA